MCVAVVSFLRYRNSFFCATLQCEWSLILAAAALYYCARVGSRKFTNKKKNIYVKTSEFILVIGKTSFFHLWTIQNAFNDFNWKAQKVIKFKSPFNCLKLFVSHTDYCFLLTHYYLVSNLPSQNPMISFTRKPLAIMMLMLLQFFIISIYFIIIDI